MAVPEFVYFIRPTLELLGDAGTLDLGSIRQEVSGRLGLTDDDLAETVASGGTTKAVDRTNWALAYLKAARLLEQPKRGVYTITSRGREFLATAPSVIRQTHLAEFPEFRTFHQGRRGIAAPVTVELAATQATSLSESTTPEENLASSYDLLHSRLATDVLERVKGMSPSFFERLIVDLMLRLGYGGPSGDGQVLGRTGDGGVDGVINQDKLGLEKIYLQAKRYTSGTVGSPEVQGFAGALMGHGARKGVFITTSGFSNGAKQYVSGLKDYKISLIDGMELASLMIDHDLGVALARRYDVKRIDSDFFTEATP